MYQWPMIRMLAMAPRRLHGGRGSRFGHGYKPRCGRSVRRFPSIKFIQMKRLRP